MKFEQLISYIKDGMPKSLAILIILLSLSSCEDKNNTHPTVSLIPWPRNIEIKTKTLSIGSDLVFVNSSGNGEVEKIINTFINDFNEIGFISTAQKGDIEVRKKSVKIEFLINEDETDSLGKEGYFLSVDEHISVTAASVNGLFWGSRTLLQILQNGPGHSIPELEISDKPEFGYRGLMIDVARHFHSLDFHLEILKKMAYYKLNYYMIHFSDHQSYTLPSDIYPDLPTPGRNYSKDEIRELVKRAEEYNITIVPSVDVPGHSGALIEAIPELKFDDRRRSLNIASEDTYIIIQEIFEELMELFPGPVWHLGADEVHYPDLADSPTKDYLEWMEKNNLAQGYQLLNYFINRMYDFVKGKGYKMFVWEGFKPQLEPKVNTEIIVCPFDIKFKDKMPGDYMDAGYTILNTAWTPLYIADKTSMTPPETLAKWDAYMFGAGRSPQPFRYWQKFSPEDIPVEIIGAQMCVWNIEEKAGWGLLFGPDEGPGFPDYGRPGPRLQIFSEKIWNGDKTTAKDILERTGSAYWDY